MRRVERFVPWFLTATLVGGFTWLMLTAIANVGQSVDDLKTRLQESPMAETAPTDETQELISTWVSGSTTHEVKTVRGANEPLDDFIARHSATLAAMQAAFPPN